MKFPRRKNDIVALTLEVLNGISANASDFPDPPFVIGELSSAFTDAQSAMNSRQAKEAELDIAIADERAKFANLKAELRKMLDLAEAYHRANPEKLSLISWGTNSEPVSAPPAQPLNLSAIRLYSGAVQLDWRAGQRTESNGPVRFYRIERRQRGESSEQWSEWETDKSYSTTRTQLTVYNQPLGVELEYRIVAVNVAGQSTPSNTAAIVA